MKIWPFTTIEKLKKENEELKKIINGYEVPIKLEGMLSAEQWGKLSTEETIHRMRKLDLVLTLKKQGRWDYHNNCMRIDKESK